jgi:hypothetical protein
MRSKEPKTEMAGFRSQNFRAFEFREKSSNKPSPFFLDFMDGKLANVEIYLYFSGIFPSMKRNKKYEQTLAFLRKEFGAMEFPEHFFPPYSTRDDNEIIRSWHESRRVFQHFENDQSLIILLDKTFRLPNSDPGLSVQLVDELVEKMQELFSGF